MAQALGNCSTIGDIADLIISLADESEGADKQKNYDITVLGDDGGERADAELVKAEFKVWYGTNRRPARGAMNYSSARDDITHYGCARVFVPRSHRIGSIGSPLWKRILTLTDDRLRLLEAEEWDSRTFWERLRAQIVEGDGEKRKALVFIHGYNVSFNEAALRAAQIGFDLSIGGAMAFFSWPSQGTLAGYLKDEATIQVSEDAIAQFLIDFVERSAAESVHIIAHSMGNRAVLEAVNKIALKVRNISRKPFAQIILAAADVDSDRFRQRYEAYSDVAIRTTLYISSRDVAVGTSRWLHGFSRAGLMPPVLVLPGVDTINVTNVDLTRLGHSYVAAAREVLRDMHELIEHSASPDLRFATRAMTTDRGEQFWEIGS
jgi:esterase/lipase superfamily enzyme